MCRTETDNLGTTANLVRPDSVSTGLCPGQGSGASRACRPHTRRRWPGRYAGPNRYHCLDTSGPALCFARSTDRPRPETRRPPKGCVGAPLKEDAMIRSEETYEGDRDEVLSTAGRGETMQAVLARRWSRRALLHGGALASMTLTLGPGGML